MSEMPLMSSYSVDEQGLSNKLYAILTSYLKGSKCLNLVRSEMKHKDGFRLWKQLHQEFLPSTRSRSLALAQALAGYPSFPKEKSVLECILNYEELVAQFEELSGSDYPDELKSATLIRCAEASVRQHLQLTIKDSTTYQEIKDAILSHEKASKTWSQDSILKSVNINRPTDPLQSNGPMPMEVDRIEDKGKSKGKGKFKGKAKSWWSAFPFGGKGPGRGKGRGVGRGKGKSKQKGKKGQKGKSKTKNGKGKTLDQNQCRICHGFGHWSRDCPQRVQQVTDLNNPALMQTAIQVPVQPRTSMTGSVASGQTASTSSTLNTAVRRIFHIGPPSESSYAPSTIQAPSHVQGIILEVPEISTEEDQCRSVIILDSGSDVSLLPMSFASSETETTGVRLQDCQGMPVETAGQKEATLVVRDIMSGEDIELHHRFLVGNVKTCILSLGELYKNGWTVLQDGGSPVLVPPSGDAKIPVFFQRNSLAMEASVFRIESEIQNHELNEVRAVVRVSQFHSEKRYGAWDVEAGHPFMRILGSHFIDPGAVWGAGFQFRTTFIQRVSDAADVWQVAELSRRFLEMEDPFCRIPDVPANEQYLILTILSEKDENLAHFGALLEGGGEVLVPEAEAQEEAAEEQADADIGAEVIEEGRDVPEETEPRQMVPRGENEEVIHVGGLEISQHSNVQDLRSAAKFLKVSSSGTKAKIFQRIRNSHEVALRRRSLEVAREQYAILNPEPSCVNAPVPERKLHEVTHLPFKRWCGFCVQGKSKMDMKYATPTAEVAERTHPTVQCDIFFQSGGNALLLMVDCWSKYIHVHSLKN